MDVLKTNMHKTRRMTQLVEWSRHRPQQAGVSPFVHVDTTTSNFVDTPVILDLHCTAPECTRQLGLIALMRRLGLGPEQEQYKNIFDLTR